MIGSLMVFIKTNEEIELMRQSNLLVSKTLAEVSKYIAPGVTTLMLDKVAYEFILSHNAKPGFLGYRNYPATLCTSVNNQVVHGIPSKRVLQEGDIVSIDCGVLLNGFYGDSAYTFMIGETSDELKKLLQVTKEALYKGIEMAVEGNRIGDISYAIQQHAEKHSYSVVRELVGHGIGRNLHEDPEVPNYGKRGNGMKLQKGMTIAIEPMINMGKSDVREDVDRWTIFTADGKPSAHFEHTIVIGEKKADILSTFNYIEEIIKEKE